MSKSSKKKHEEAAAAAAGEESTAAAAESAATADAPAAAGADDVAPAGPEEEAPDPVAVLAAERDEFKDKWLRTVAELDNVRKRASRDLVQGRRFAQADILRAFLEVVDNFERALQSVPGDADTGTPDPFREGVELIHQRLRGVLKDQGVEPIEALAAAFDPNVHEAVGQFEREGVEPGVVIEVAQQGYRFGELVLRPARVIISA
ncbi:nucleotide exchange factor GrpE [bacterium]|nr:nucleotide exchange factor GrpE [bacterium]